MQTSKNALSVRHEPKGSLERRQSTLERGKMMSAGTEPALQIVETEKAQPAEGSGDASVNGVTFGG